MNKRLKYKKADRGVKIFNAEAFYEWFYSQDRTLTEISHEIGVARSYFPTCRARGTVNTEVLERLWARYLLPFGSFIKKEGLSSEQVTVFRVGQYIIYHNGSKFELGRIKSLTADGAFVAYGEGKTGAKTAFDLMHPLVNEYAIIKTALGGDYFKEEQ